MSAEEQDRLCKICLEKESETEKMPDCHPCKCTGSLKYVHSSCLDKWLRTTSTKHCELCFYRYRFRNIYRNGTPERVGILVIVRVLFENLRSTLLNVFRVSFGVSLRIFGMYLTSAFHALLFSGDRVFFGEHHFINGPFLALMMLGARSLKSLVFRKVDLLKKRRMASERLHLVRSSLETGQSPYTSAIPSDAPEISLPEYAEMGYRDTADVAERYHDSSSAHRDASNIQRRNAGGTAEQTSVDREQAQESADDNSEPYVSMSTPIEDPLASASSGDSISEESGVSKLNVPLAASLSANFQWLVSNVMITLAVKVLLLPSFLVGRFFALLGDSVGFVRFLEAQGLAPFFGSMLGFPIGVLFFSLVLSVLARRSRHRVFLNVLFFLYCEIFVSTAFLGVMTNYVMFRFFGFRCFLFRTQALKRPMLMLINGSVVLNQILGSLVVLLLSSPILVLKSIYRRGALFLFRNASEFDIIKKILTCNFAVLTTHQFIMFFLYGMSIMITAHIHKGTLAEIAFEIHTYKKLLAYLILFSAIFNRLRALSKLGRMLLQRTLFFLCRTLSCEDYFFAAKQCQVDKKRLRWCPNRDAKYSRRQRRLFFAKPFNESEFKRFYLERKESYAYALYHIPRFFKHRCAAIHVCGFFVVQFAANLLFRTSLAVECTALHLLSAERAFLDRAFPRDVRFLVANLCVLTVLQIFNELSESMRGRAPFASLVEKTSGFFKVFVNYVFRAVLWPLIATIVVLNSLGISSDPCGGVLFLYCTIDIFLAAVVVIHVLAMAVGTIGLFPAVEMVTVSELLRRLVFFTALNILIIFATSFYDAVVVRRTLVAGYGHIYLLTMLVLVFVPIFVYYCLLFLKRSVSFFRNIKEELFLVKRQAINYEDN